MARTTTETKLSQHRAGREMKRVAASEHPHVLGIPVDRRVRPVRVEPPAVVIVFHVEHVGVAVGARTIRIRAAQTTTS